MEFIPSFGGLLYTLAAFVVALSIIVAVHEYGHYIIGKWSGIKAEVFSIGFGPVLASRVDKHGTRWQVAALPLGGYVKFLGDAGAASDKAADDYDALPEDMKRHTMHGAPLWARAATVAAGPIFNFILSIAIFAAIIGLRGFASDPLTVAEVNPSPITGIELQAGDEILAINGIALPTLEEIDTLIDDLPNDALIAYEVRRGSDVLTVDGPFPYPPAVMSITPGSAAMDAGLQINDVITELNGAPMFGFRQLSEVISEGDGAAVEATIWRDGETFTETLVPRRMDLPTAEGGFETRWLIGISGGLFMTPATESPGIFEAIGYGYNQMVFIIQMSLSGLWHMVTGAISSCNIQGPIGIAETSSAAASQGLTNFIWFVAVLSTAVGMLNLFPVPVLDGGHLVFHAYEAVRGKPPSDQALRVMMGVGFAMLMGLMAFALTNDLFCP